MNGPNCTDLNGLDWIEWIEVGQNGPNWTEVDRIAMLIWLKRSVVIINDML